jgi:hypothetical protein
MNLSAGAGISPPDPENEAPPVASRRQQRYDRLDGTLASQRELVNLEARQHDGWKPAIDITCIFLK